MNTSEEREALMQRLGTAPTHETRALYDSMTIAELVEAHAAFSADLEHADPEASHTREFARSRMKLIAGIIAGR